MMIPKFCRLIKRSYSLIEGRMKISISASLYKAFYVFFLRPQTRKHAVVLWPWDGGRRARTTKEITSTYFWLFVSLFFGESFQSFRWGSASHLNGYITHPKSEPVGHSTI
uniref:Uncharacterized protein n=2 Tax=Triticum urartu TaxID=4572 RepID=A0A8R7UDQ2_TRIUA